MKKSGKNTVHGKSIEFNRKALENKQTKELILNHRAGKDRLNQRDSGLNHILCKIAGENSITFIIDLNELKEEKDQKTRAEILSRILQNIKLIKKYKNNLKLINYKNKEQALSFLLSLGLPTDMSKEAVE